MLDAAQFAKFRKKEAALPTNSSVVGFDNVIQIEEELRWYMWSAVILADCSDKEGKRQGKLQGRQSMVLISWAGRYLL